MSNLNEIIQNIKDKNFDQALKLCRLYENSNNSHIVFNLKGSIHYLQNNFDLAELFYAIHIFGNYTLITLISLHILAVISHKIIFKENLLKKIL